MLKRTKGEKIFAVFNTIGLVLLSVIFIVPIWHVLMGSISDPLKISAHSGLILSPLGQMTLGGYKLVFSSPRLRTSMNVGTRPPWNIMVKSTIMENSGPQYRFFRLIT